MSIDELRRVGLGLARKILDRLSEILADEFPTDSPQILGDILKRVLAFITSLVESSNDERILKYACTYLQELGSHLRYIEGASSARIPTSIITPLETFIGQIDPDARVMLRVQSSYNYEIFDIIRYYRIMFAELLGAEIEGILGPTKTLYVVAVPAIEHSNILLHTILAHEAGHRIAHKYLDSEDQETLVNNINSLIGTDLKWWDPDFDKLPPLWRLPIQQKIFQLIHKARASALKELISDAVAYYLCGISVLFALEDFCCADILDAVPEETYGFYPPWRYRLRQLVSIAYTEDFLAGIDRITGNPPLTRIRDAGRTRLVRLKAITEQDTDLTILENDPVLKRAYSDVPEILTTIYSFISREVSGSRYTNSMLGEETPPLLERLALGIPPDEAKEKIPDIRSVLAAGWLYKTPQLSIPYDENTSWESNHDEIVNRLVLKAIESIQLIKNFSEETKKGSE